MQNKKWIANGEARFAFFIDNAEVGSLSFKPADGNSTAVAKIGNKIYQFKRTGFWKSSIDVIDNSGQVVMHVFYKKWYANTSILKYKGKEYELVIRNNPMAEWAILDEGKDYLAYGLIANDGGINIKIKTNSETMDLLFDFLLWYLFAPIAQENNCGDFMFHLLAAG
ncbi:MAG: hypothetical protein K2Q24_15650 [Chitinophagaceae bacterium]|jgi:hypothetical protein|nr:hypothetical protein [Chitinophagaceae bacterium]